MTVKSKLGNFKVLTFDCYGTLIDWETGIWDALQPLIAANEPGDGAADGIERSKALAAFAKCEHVQQAETPQLLYPGLLAATHARIAAELGLSSNDQLDAEFGQSVAHWPAFADSANALRYLKTRYRLVILSNVHRDGIAASMRKLGVDFDAVYTAEDIGSYKPADANFEYLLQHLKQDFNLDRADILHTAQSLFHDHVPAKKFGLANAWIDRQRLAESGNSGVTALPEERPETLFRFTSLAEMAGTLRAERAS